MRNSFLDTVKGVTILAVVLIHMLNSIYPTPYDLNLAGFSYRATQQLLRFAVPIFIGISGYLLVGSYERSLNLLAFYRKRILSLLPLYLLWTLAFVILLNPTYPWWLTWMMGAGDYQLYFVPVIVSLYLIFPILYRYANLAISISLLIQVAFYLYIQLHPHTPFLFIDQFYYRFILSWIWYFCLGIFFAKNQLYKISNWLSALLILAGILVATVEGELLLRQGANIVNSLLTTRLTIMLYSTGLLFLIFSNLNILVKRNYLSIVGEQSYLIFLSHTLLIRGQILGFSIFLLLSLIVQKLSIRWLK